MKNAVDALIFRLGPYRMAVELHLVSSVLAADEAHGMGRLDPRPFLPGSKNGDEESSLRVGLLDVDGPPTVLLLGEIVGARTFKSPQILGLPPWLAAHLPPILRPACVVVDQKVVWLLDLDTLKEAPS